MIRVVPRSVRMLTGVQIRCRTTEVARGKRATVVSELITREEQTLPMQ